MTKFSDLKLDPKVLTAIAEAGYETPTPIQAGAIPPALEGRDVLGIAQTGTGKTAGFVLPMITLLDRGRARARMPRSLVLCPTRELAAQVAENFDIYAKYTRLTKALLIGGVSFGEQDKLIDRGVDVLIATPGRLLDHFERGKLLLTGVQIMVVDEADRMLDMGFIPDIERIFQLTPFTRQTLFFSATMAPEIERITNTFLHAPERIEVARQATTSETITQKLVELTPTRKDQTSKQKRELLRALIDAEGEGLTNAIIFCNRKTDVDILAKSLKSHGYDAEPIHGDLDQSHRTRTLDGFRDGRLKLLIASDVAARGLDIPAVSHVFNFDLPSHAEDYVHRIGRTGRAGRKGTAISIRTPADDKLLAAIESLVKQTLPRASLPQGFTPAESGRSSSPRPRDEGKGAGRSSNGRRRSERRDDHGQTDATTAPEAPASPPQPVARRDDNRSQRDARQDQRRGRGRDDARGPAIRGMGDHVPGFMLVELRPALASAADSADPTDIAAPASGTSAPNAPEPEAPTPKTPAVSDQMAAPVTHDTTPAEAPAPETPADEVSTPETVAPQAPADDTPAADKAPAPTPRRPRRRAEPKTEPKPEPEAETKPEPEAVEPAAEAEPAPPADPAPKPARTRRKTAAPAATTDDTSAAEAPAAKPRRSRARKTDPATPTGTEPAAEAAPKPSRSRRKPAAADDTATPDVANPEAEAPAPKPRRTRRKPATAAEDSTPDTPPADAKPATTPSTDPET